MHSKETWFKISITVVASWAFLLSGLLSEAQDFVISSNIAGGSSIFAFPKSRKQPKKYVTSSKSSFAGRTRVERSATRKRISSQYDSLAKVANRRREIKVIRPEDLIPREDPVKASLALTGAAQWYFNEKQFDKAIDYFREANQLNSKNDLARLSLSDALTLKGNELLDAGDSTTAFAVTFYQEAVQLNEGNSAAYAGLGEAFEQQGDAGKAIESYEKALQIDPDLTQVTAPLGILYFQKGDIEKADSLLKKALALEPDDAKTQFFSGLVFYTRNENAAAEAAFRKAAALDAKFDDAHFYLGSTLTRLGRETEAVAEYSEAARINPKNFEAWYALGGALYNTERYQESIDAYLQAVRVKNDYAEAYANLGDSYRQLADRENRTRERYTLLGQALSRYAMALSFIESDPEIAARFSRDDLADLYSRYGFTAGEHNMLASAQGIRNNWDLSLQLLTKAAEIDNAAIDYNNLGWAYFNSARNDLKADPAAASKKLLTGKASLEKGLTLNPNQEVLTSIRMNLGITLIDLGDFKAAIDNLKPVTETRSDWAFANYSLGVAYFKNSQMEEAIRQFNKAVDADPNYVAALSGIGNAYLQLGKKKEVEKVVERLKKIGTRDAINEANRLQFASTQMR